jgi:hypothetical protein
VTHHHWSTEEAENRGNRDWDDERKQGYDSVWVRPSEMKGRGKNRQQYYEDDAKN